MTLHYVQSFLTYHVERQLQLYSYSYRPIADTAISVLHPVGKDTEGMQWKLKKINKSLR